jgi:hypothetical protein
MSETFLDEDSPLNRVFSQKVESLADIDPPTPFHQNLTGSDENVSGVPLPPSSRSEAEKEQQVDESNRSRISLEENANNLALVLQQKNSSRSSSAQDEKKSLAVLDPTPVSDSELLSYQTKSDTTSHGLKAQTITPHKSNKDSNDDNNNNNKHSEQSQQKQKHEPNEPTPPNLSTLFESSLDKWTHLMKKALTTDFLDIQTEFHRQYERGVTKTARMYAETVASLSAQVRDAQDVMGLYSQRMGRTIELVDRVSEALIHSVCWMLLLFFKILYSD